MRSPDRYRQVETHEVDGTAASAGTRTGPAELGRAEPGPGGAWAGRAGRRWPRESHASQTGCVQGAWAAVSRVTNKFPDARAPGHSARSTRPQGKGDGHFNEAILRSRFRPPAHPGSPFPGLRSRFSRLAVARGLGQPHRWRRWVGPSTPDGAIGRVAAPQVKRSRRLVCGPGWVGRAVSSTLSMAHRLGASRVDGAIDPVLAGSTAPSAGTDLASGQTHEAAVTPGLGGARPVALGGPRSPGAGPGAGAQSERLPVTSKAHAANVTRGPGQALGEGAPRAQEWRPGPSRRRRPGGRISGPSGTPQAARSSPLEAAREVCSADGPDDGDPGRSQAQRASIHPGTGSAPAGGSRRSRFRCGLKHRAAYSVAYRETRNILSMRSS